MTLPANGRSARRGTGSPARGRLRWLLALGLGLSAARMPAQEPPAWSRCDLALPDYRLELFPRAVIPGQRPLLLALGGGGAKGIAHLGVLQRLQEEGIPVAGVAGTSMGAIMGSLYAAGYSGAGIQTLLEQVDLGALILDREHRVPGETLGEQEDQRGALFSLQFRPGAGLEATPSSISGQDLNRVLQIVLSRGLYHARGSFDQLRVPFRAVASDLQTGRPSAPARGELASVVRASMSIPGAFRPVTLGGDQMVDGMLVQNLPVETARQLVPGGAVLAVEVGGSLEATRQHSPLAMAVRALDVSIEGRTEISRRAADLLLRPATDRFSYVDFHHQVGLMALEGRRTFNDHLDALESVLYGPEADLPAPGGPLAIHAPDRLREPILDLAAACLPEGPRTRRHYLRLLRRIAAAGWARHADLAFGPEGPALDLEAFPDVARMDLEVPAGWQPVLLQELKGAGVRAGAPFNPVGLGLALDRFLVRATLQGRPLLDLEGTGFDPARGVLRVRVRDIILQSVRVQEGVLSPAQTVYVRNLLTPYAGQPVWVYGLAKDLLLAEKRLGLEEIRVDRDPGSAVPDLCVLPVPDDRIRLEGTLAYETTWHLHGAASLQANRFLGSDFNLGLHASRDRLWTLASLDLSRTLGRWPRLGWRMTVAQADFKYLPEALDGPFEPEPALPGLVDRYLQERDLGMEVFAHFGGDDRGRDSLEYHRRWARNHPQPGGPGLPRADEVRASAEWDDFDRCLFPAQGTLVRFRLGQGWLDSRDPETGRSSYRFAYARARRLWPLGAWASFEGDLEAGLGWRLPRSRWYAVGGPEFLAGTPSSAYRLPTFALSRFGLPFQVVQVLGVNLQVVPRFDTGYLGQGEPGQLISATRVRGASLALRSELGEWYCEVSVGRWRSDTPGRAQSAQVNLLVGTHPFDLWREP